MWRVHLEFVALSVNDLEAVDRIGHHEWVLVVFALVFQLVVIVTHVA
jgi:hypothetical protein